MFLVMMWINNYAVMRDLRGLQCYRIYNLKANCSMLLRSMSHASYGGILGGTWIFPRRNFPRQGFSGGEKSGRDNSGGEKSGQGKFRRGKVRRGKFRLRY